MKPSVKEVNPQSWYVVLYNDEIVDHGENRVLKECEIGEAIKYFVSDPDFVIDKNDEIMLFKLCGKARLKKDVKVTLEFMS